METRVIVADSARARIFSSHGTLSQLEEIEGFAHPEARASNRDITSDAAGKSVDQHGSLDPATSARDHEAENFARLLGRHLKDLHNAQHFDQLMLVAPPRFLGLLRKQLPKPLDQLVEVAVDKDLSEASLEEIIDCIRS
mgnify:CR=1 FL=1